MDVKHVKHPTRGYLSEEEFTRMMEGSHAEREYMMKLAQKREQEAKKGRGKR